MTVYFKWLLEQLFKDSEGNLLFSFLPASYLSIIFWEGEERNQINAQIFCLICPWFCKKSNVFFGHVLPENGEKVMEAILLASSLKRRLSFGGISL